MLSSAEKKAIAIILIVAMVFVVIVGSTVAALTVGHHDENDDLPYLQIAAGKKFTRVEPMVWCSVQLTACHPANVNNPHPPTRFAVDPGDTVVLTVSDELATGPWRLVSQFLTPAGGITRSQYFRPNSTYTLTIPTSRDRTLVTLEVQAPSQVQTAENEFVIRGYLGVDTRPEGVELPA